MRVCVCFFLGYEKQNRWELKNSKAMDSKVYVPLSTTQAVPVPRNRAFSSSSSLSTGSQSLPIRAPPTLDSDSDSESIGPNKTLSLSSSISSGGYNGYESEEQFLTGEEFESASERPSVADPDEETLEKSESFDFSGPFVRDADGKSLENSIEYEGESDEIVEPVLADNRVMPKARLSMDDDDDDIVVEEEEEMVSAVDEDGGVSGPVRVPSIEELEKFDSALRIKALGVEEDELVEWRDSFTSKQSEPAIEVKVVEGAVLDGFVGVQNGVLGVGEEKALVVEEPGEASVLAEVIEDKGPGVTEAAYVETLMPNGEDVMEKNLRLDEDVKYYGEEKGVDNEGLELNRADGGEQEIVGLSEDGAEKSSGMVEETSITVNETDIVSSGTEDCIDSTQLKKQIAVTNGFAETKECNLLESNFSEREVDASGSFTLYEGSDNENGMDLDEEVDSDREGERSQLFNSAALEALLKAVSGAGSEESPAGLGSSFHSLQPAPNPNRLNVFSSDIQVEDESEDSLSEEEKKKIEKIQLVRVKFLRLVRRLGVSPEDTGVSKVLYRLATVAGRHFSQTFSLELAAKRLAMQLEAEGKDDLDFSLNILVLGKTGVGKSATINSIFGMEKAMIGAFEPVTTTVKEIVGTVGGVKIRFLDTPGLRSSVMEQSINRKILASVKKFLK